MCCLIGFSDQNFVHLSLIFPACYMSHTEVKCGRGVLLTTHPLLAPRSWKSRAIPLPPSGPHTAFHTSQ